jgi:hypothetical protein
LHVSAADGAPGLEVLVADIARTFGVNEESEDVALVPVQMDGYNSDWDILYPFSAVRPFLFPLLSISVFLIECTSQFLTPYKIPLAVDPGYVSPWVAGSNTNVENGFTITALDDVKDHAAGTRSLTLRIDHPGLIWTGTFTTGFKKVD